MITECRFLHCTNERNHAAKHPYDTMCKDCYHDYRKFNEEMKKS